MDAVRPRFVMVDVVDLRLLNADDRCKLLLGELLDALTRSDLFALCLTVAGGRTVEDDVVDEDHREGDGRRN